MSSLPSLSVLSINDKKESIGGRLADNAPHPPAPLPLTRETVNQILDLHGVLYLFLDDRTTIMNRIMFGYLLLGQYNLPVSDASWIKTVTDVYFPLRGSYNEGIRVGGGQLQIAPITPSWFDWLNYKNHVDAANFNKNITVRKNRNGLFVRRTNTNANTHPSLSELKEEAYFALLAASAEVGPQVYALCVIDTPPPTGYPQLYMVLDQGIPFLPLLKTMSTNADVMLYATMMTTLCSNLTKIRMMLFDMKMDNLIIVLDNNDPPSWVLRAIDFGADFTVVLSMNPPSVDTQCLYFLNLLILVAHYRCNLPATTQGKQLLQVMHGQLQTSQALADRMVVCETIRKLTLSDYKQAQRVFSAARLRGEVLTPPLTDMTVRTPDEAMRIALIYFERFIHYIFSLWNQHGPCYNPVALVEAKSIEEQIMQWIGWSP